MIFLWFCEDIFNICISNSVRHFFISVVKIYGDTDGVIIFLLLFLHGLSIIALSFVFALFLNQEKYAFLSCMAIIIFSVSGYIYPNVDTSVGVKWLTALISPVALELGLSEVCVLRPLINLSSILGCKKIQSCCFFCSGCSLIYFFLF